jgi:INO80 complex subunit C
MATQDNSGAATPLPDDSGMSTDGESTPRTPSNSTLQPNLAQASRNLSKLVLEKNMKTSTGVAGGFGSAPGVTYMNIESAPTLAHSKHYCDITGLGAPYMDPKTRMRYHNKEVFGVVRSLGQGVAEQYLEARGAHTILK